MNDENTSIQQEAFDLANLKGNVLFIQTELNIKSNSAKNMSPEMNSRLNDWQLTQLQSEFLVSELPLLLINA